MWHLSTTASKDEIEYLSTLLEEISLSVSWFEKDEAQSIWELKAIFEEEPCANLIKDTFSSLPYHLSPLPPTDWLTENRKDLPPLEIGNFFISNSYYEGALPSDKIIFKIDAATAFGTGQHATTRSCLQALEDLKNESIVVHNFLDLGCGTAILAMAMVRLFQVSGIAADNDPEAVEKAIFNCQDNHLKDQIKVILSEGFSADQIQKEAPYSLIAANILAGPLIDLAPAINHYLGWKGYVVLSGLLQTQQSKVQKAYEQQGFLLYKYYTDQDWTTLVMRKL